MKLANPARAVDPIGSASSTRDAIVAALATVTGLNVHRSAPSQPQPWDAFPRWTITNYTGGRMTWLGVAEYDAMVVLPAGYEPDTVEQGDSMLDRVVRALLSIGVVQSAEPVRATFDAGVGVPALRIHVIPHLNATTTATT